MSSPAICDWPTTLPIPCLCCATSKTVYIHQRGYAPTVLCHILEYITCQDGLPRHLFKAVLRCAPPLSRPSLDHVVCPPHGPSLERTHLGLTCALHCWCVGGGGRPGLRFEGVGPVRVRCTVFYHLQLPPQQGCLLLAPVLPCHVQSACALVALWQAIWGPGPHAYRTSSPGLTPNLALQCVPVSRTPMPQCEHHITDGVVVVVPQLRVLAPRSPPVAGACGLALHWQRHGRPAANGSYKQQQQRRRRRWRQQRQPCTPRRKRPQGGWQRQWRRGSGRPRRGP